MLRGKFRLSKSGRNITTGNALDSSFRMEFHSEKYPFLVLPITAAFFVFLEETELRRFTSRGSSQPRDQTRVSYVYLHWQVGSLPLARPGKPSYTYEWLLKEH